MRLHNVQGFVIVDEGNGNRGLYVVHQNPGIADSQRYIKVLGLFADNSVHVADELDGHTRKTWKDGVLPEGAHVVAQMSPDFEHHASGRKVQVPAGHEGMSKKELNTRLAQQPVYAKPGDNPYGTPLHPENIKKDEPSKVGHDQEGRPLDAKDQPAPQEARPIKSEGGPVDEEGNRPGQSGNDHGTSVDELDPKKPGDEEVPAKGAAGHIEHRGKADGEQKAKEEAVAVKTKDQTHKATKGHKAAATGKGHR